ncbi:MAG: DUF1501 domain-containing protein, partial [Gemmataceae bacterium]|nr:DUF1501 domain-containing protein [Gemmataceae bacterium]
MEPLRHGVTRREFLGRTLAGSAFLSALGWQLANAAAPPARQRSLILLWMSGGPSQLETFDPHEGKDIAGGTRSIKTASGARLAAGLERLADQMAHVSLVRSMMSKEGDHERGAYTVRTGNRPDPTVIHPSIGAILCHELPVAGVDIPRHVSIMPDRWSGRGGHLGDQYDSFRTGDPRLPVPDTVSHGGPRDGKRLELLNVAEKAFAKGRGKRVEATGHRDTMARARTMMSSEQLKAFDVSREPLAVQCRYGDTPFGRGCLAARRLTEAGVRCVEVTLGNWDTHADNHRLCRNLVDILDPAFAALVADLRERGTLDRTMVVCAGEFGRTPKINPFAGRDHWPTGFSVALAGGGLRGGAVVGETDPEGGPKPKDPVTVESLHATLL